MSFKYATPDPKSLARMGMLIINPPRGEDGAIEVCCECGNRIPAQCIRRYGELRSLQHPEVAGVDCFILASASSVVSVSTCQRGCGLPIDKFTVLDLGGYAPVLGHGLTADGTAWNFHAPDGVWSVHVGCIDGAVGCVSDRSAELIVEGDDWHMWMGLYRLRADVLARIRFALTPWGNVVCGRVTAEGGEA